MRGLLWKDLCLLGKRKLSLLLPLLLLPLLSGQGSAFFVCFCCIFGVILGVGTISYDEFDNGFPFLLCLPVTRKDYVREKFLFCLLCALCFWLLGNVLALIAGLAAGSVLSLSDLGLSLLLLPIVGVFVAIQLPLQLKYGPEKSRLVMCFIVGFSIGLFLIVDRWLGGSGTGASGLAPNPTALAAVMLLIAAAALTLSYRCSLRILNRKSF